MDLAHEFQKKHQTHQNIVLPLNPTPQNIIDESPTPNTLTTPQYFSGLIERLLEHDPRKKIIEKLLHRLFAEKLFGSQYVKLYLMEPYRQNCRPNTLRAYTATFTMFIGFLQKAGHACFKTVKREDLAAFIEHEQDRGLKPKAVLTRLNHIWAFMRFMVNRSFIHPDILKRKM